MRTHTSQFRPTWKPNKSRDKSLNTASSHQNPAPIQENAESVAQQDSTALPEKPWGLITGNVMRTLATKEPGSSQGMVLQPKLTIGEPEDKYEQEADRVAKQVVRQINKTHSESRPLAGTKGSVDKGLQMKAESDGIQSSEKLGVGTVRMKPQLQLRQSGRGSKASSEIETSLNQLKSSGQPLTKGLQRSMGQAMGADFSGVRVHMDSKSDTLNRSLSSRAFTTGEHVFFKQGEYNPSSKGGQELIAHELTHVVQQKPGMAQKGDDVNRKPTTDRPESKGIVELHARQGHGRHIQRQWVNNINIHRETLQQLSLFSNAGPGITTPETGLRIDSTHQTCDIDLSSYPHIKQQALTNYSNQAQQGNAYITQSEVMDVDKSPSDVWEYPAKDGPGVMRYSPQIGAIIFHAGGQCVTVHPRSGKYLFKVGWATKSVMEEIGGYTNHIVQADPRHASTHNSDYYKFTALNPHDHWFKWPIARISESDKKQIESWFIEKGKIKLGQAYDEFADRGREGAPGKVFDVTEEEKGTKDIKNQDWSL